MATMRRGAHAATVCLALAWIGPAAAQQIASPAPAPDVAATVAQASPLIDQVRRLVAGGDPDRVALAAFYGEAGAKPLWITDGRLNARAAAAIVEIRNAADWGLDPKTFETPDPAAVLDSAEAQAGAEAKLSIAALKYARYARGGRIDPAELSRGFDQKPPLLQPKSVIEELAAAPQTDAYLRGLHPKHPQFEKLRQALLALRKPAPDVAPEPGASVKIPVGPRLKQGQKHAQIALLRVRLNATTATASPQVFDEPLAAMLREFQLAKGIEPDGVLDNVTRQALNGAARPATGTDPTTRILVNMERWRWLPEDLGSFHVWDNVPEFRMRVMKDGQVVHTESIIVGKPSTPTPIFSADMKYVVFHPNWGVPDGIKMNELAPSLRRSSASGGFESLFGWGESAEPAILRRHNLKVSYNGRPVDPSKVNWATADIRQFQFTQPPSASNVLGVVKFRFPNKHDVYMHDTPERALFARADKAFSHGCMRVHNPQRLAEVLLAEDQNWSAGQVRAAIAGGATQDISIAKRIPVHVTYFTAMVDDDGKLKTYGDLYGYDSRIAAALDGKAVKLIAQSDPAVKAERELRRNRPQRVASGKSGGGLVDVFSGLFGN